MSLILRSIAIVAGMFLFTGCASIVSKSNWPLTINSNPSGAKITITNKKGREIFQGTTPSIVKLKSGAGFFEKESYVVRLSLEGYNEKLIPVECKLNGWYIGNIVFGGVIGFLIVDPATGAMFKLDTEYMNETLTKAIAYSGPSLQILDINTIPDAWKVHLISLR